MTAEQIYISSQGKQWGPYTVKQVDFLLGKGSFQLSDWAWAESFAGWVALAELLGSLRRSEPIVAQPAIVAAVLPNEALLALKRPLRVRGRDRIRKASQSKRDLCGLRARP